MPMALGGTRRAMALYGIPEWTRDGRHITMAIGLGSSRGAGLGSTMPPGASRRLTTAAGPTPVAVGAGYPDRWPSLPADRREMWSTRRRWSRLSGGGGGGASLSIGGPAVGWVPLGPGEVYAPAYHMSQNYFRTVNVSNTTVVNTVNITNVYNNVYVNKNVTNVTVNEHFANMAAPNAVTAMPQNSFASGRPVKQGGITVTKAQAAQVQAATMTVAPSVAPVKQALAPMAGARPAPQPPARATSVQVVAKKAPPPPPRSSRGDR